MTKFPYLMQKILNLILYRHEINLACYLTAFYEFNFTEEMVEYAIDFDYFHWLNYVWVFNKNFILSKKRKKE